MKKALISMIIAIFLIISVTTASAVFAEEITPETAEETIAETVADIAEVERETWGAWLLGKCKLYMSEIMSGLSVIVGVIICAIFKKGLIPTLAGNLSSLSASSKDATSKIANITKTTAENIDKFMDNYAPLIDKMADVLGKNETLLAMLAEENKNIKQTELLSAGILNEVIQCSTLPQWRKEAAAKEYDKIKKINASESGDGDSE